MADSSFDLPLLNRYRAARTVAKKLISSGWLALSTSESRAARWQGKQPVRLRSLWYQSWHLRPITGVSSGTAR
jgi:hypothetical protein